MQEILSAVQLMSNNQSTGGQFTTMIISMVLIIVVFYFILIRPQKKKDKEAKAMRENIQIGDEIMTIGIVGLVVRKSEDTVVIETGGDKSKLRIKNWAVQENITLTEKANAAKAAKANEIMEARQKKKEKKSDK